MTPAARHRALATLVQTIVLMRWSTRGGQMLPLLRAVEHALSLPEEAVPEDVVVAAQALVAWRVDGVHPPVEYGWGGPSDSEPPPEDEARVSSPDTLQGTGTRYRVIRRQHGHPTRTYGPFADRRLADRVAKYSVEKYRGSVVEVEPC